MPPPTFLRKKLFECILALAVGIGVEKAYVFDKRYEMGKVRFGHVEPEAA